jgi:iron complex outermembrane receptor protein
VDQERGLELGRKPFARTAGNLAVHAVVAGLGVVAPHAGWAADADQIEEVVVAARKRAENLQSIPVAVTDLGARDIERDDLSTMGKFTSRLPSFTMATSNPKQTNIGVRGIGNNGGNNDGIDSSVGVFVDGVYAGRLGEVSGDFNDLERIDLLRGPQGTLFGKNTVAGALLIESQKPSFTPEAKAEGILGNYGFKKFNANLSGPVAGDKLALRLSAYYTDRDGYETNLANKLTYDGHQGQGFKLQALLQPTETLNLRLIAAHSSTSDQTPLGIYYGAFPGATATLSSRMRAQGYSQVSDPFNRVVNVNEDQSSRTHTDFLALHANWETDHGTVTSISGFRNWYFHPYNDNDGTQLDAIRQFGTNNNINQFSQEVRWASPVGGPVDGVLGAYAYYQDLRANQKQALGRQYWIYAAAPSAANMAASGVAGCTTQAQWNAGAAACATALGGAGWGSKYQTKDEAYALFGHGNWHLTDDTTLFAGLRETWEWKTADWRGWVNDSNGFSTRFMTTLGATVNSVHTAVKDVSLGGELGVNHKLTDGILAYAKYARGHIAKGVNAPAASANAIAAGASQAIDSEKADSVEIGAKTEWLQRRLQVNTALYDTLISRYQTTAAAFSGTGSSQSYLANVGAIRSRGIELEAVAKPLPGLRVNSYGGLNWAYYQSFHDAQCPLEDGGGVCDFTGKQVPYSSKLSAGLNTEYAREIHDGVTGYFVVDWSWRSSQNLTLQRAPLGQVKAYSVTNIRAGTRLLDDAVDLSFWVNNLFDRDYLVAVSGNKTTNQYTATPGAPLAFGSTLRVQF